MICLLLCFQTAIQPDEPRVLTPEPVPVMLLVTADYTELRDVLPEGKRISTIAGEGVAVPVSCAELRRLDKLKVDDEQLQDRFSTAKLIANRVYCELKDTTKVPPAAQEGALP